MFGNSTEKKKKIIGAGVAEGAGAGVGEGVGIVPGEGIWMSGIVRGEGIGMPGIGVGIVLGEGIGMPGVGVGIVPGEGIGMPGEEIIIEPGELAIAGTEIEIIKILKTKIIIYFFKVCFNIGNAFLFIRFCDLSHLCYLLFLFI